MKLKLDLNYEELTDLNDSELKANIVSMAHAMLDEALDRREQATKCSVTIDSDKE